MNFINDDQDESEDETPFKSVDILHTIAETYKLDYVENPEDIANKLFGSNRRVKIVPVENLGIIYNIWYMVRKYFLRVWPTCCNNTDDPSAISTCIISTLKLCIDEHYRTSYGRSYFDTVKYVSCNDRLFVRHREWIMPATDVNLNSGEKILYVLMDCTEIERFITYYWYIYGKSGTTVNVEFDSVCDKIKNVSKKLPRAYLMNLLPNNISNSSSCQNARTEMDAERDDIDSVIYSNNDLDNIDSINDAHLHTAKGTNIINIDSVIFTFTLLCVDKTISLINNMMIRSGGVARTFMKPHGADTTINNKNQISTCIIDTLDSIHVTDAESMVNYAGIKRPYSQTVNGIDYDNDNNGKSNRLNSELTIYKEPMNVIVNQSLDG